MKTLCRLLHLVVLVALLAGLVLGLPVIQAHAADDVAVFPQADPLPPGASASWWTVVQEQIRQSEYDITWQDSTYLPDVPAAYQAPNRAHGLRTYFTSEGPVVIPRSRAEEALSWQWGLRITAVPAGGARLSAEGKRIAYQYPDLPGLAEAYVNDEAGLRQELTLPSPLPGGQEQALVPRLFGEGAGGQLVLDLTCSGGLAANLAADGAEAEFKAADGADVLRYSLLAVTDTGGQPLAAHLELAGNHLLLIVDGERPAYPLTLSARLRSTAPPSDSDVTWAARPSAGLPLDSAGTSHGTRNRAATAAAPEGLSPTPNWTAEGDQLGSRFGYSVGTAGDVNGDGYADVVVGAPYYDNGQTYEGRAFVYHGSATGLSTTANWTAEGNQTYADFGYSVGTAGDVNGDGYADVVVGAPYYDNGQTDEGCAYVYHGSATGLSTTANWTAEGDQEDAEFGHSVSTAGDVNSDGYADVVVGAALYDNGLTDEGRAYVYHGSTAGLSTTANWTAESNFYGGYFGWAAGTAGDVNGDGYADVVVSAPNWYSIQVNEGAAFVYHGSAAGLSTTANWTAEGNQDSAYFGYSVGAAGDVNGDGYADVVVGADFYDNGQSNEGRAFVYHGSAAGLSTTANWTTESNQVDAYMGISVGTAGDVNGDGYADVIVGAPHYGDGQAQEGRAYLYHGSAVGLATTANWTAESDQAGARLGWSAGTAGDVNGDGYADVIVGAHMISGGQAYVYHGSAASLTSSAAWTAEGNQISAYLGLAVAGAGDVNGDGYADVVVAAPYYDGGQAAEGRAYVYHGSAAGLSTAANWTAESNQANARFGFSVAGAGDVNGDGYADVVIGAYYYDGGQTDEGAAFVYHGSAAGLGDNGTPANADWTAESDQANARFGISVAGAGDVNGDGYADVVVGADLYDGGQTDEGRAYVYHGSETGLSTSANWMAENNQAAAYLGTSVAGAGDVNGDGRGDLVVGAYGYDGGQADEGRAYVYHGSATGLSTTANWTVESNQAAAFFGLPVAGAGDVNGDGYADVVVAARYYDGGQTDEGRAYVYHGSAAGLASSAAWTAESNQAGAEFGVSVVGAGDVNGDGYADLVVGAYRYDNGQTDEGWATVYHGSAAGLASSAAWTAESNQAGAEFGTAVAGAGDVNGDGYADVIVGAYRYDNGQADEGAALVYYGNGGDGLEVHPQQRRADDSVPIAHLGQATTNAFRLAQAGPHPLWPRLGQAGVGSQGAGHALRRQRSATEHGLAGYRHGRRGARRAGRGPLAHHGLSLARAPALPPSHDAFSTVQPLDHPAVGRLERGRSAYHPAGRPLQQRRLQRGRRRGLSPDHRPAQRRFARDRHGALCHRRRHGPGRQRLPGGQRHADLHARRDQPEF